MTAEQGGEAKTAGNESLLTVIIAFSANLVIAIAKSIAAVITGSAAMLAEAAHLWPTPGTRSSC